MSQPISHSFTPPSPQPNLDAKAIRTLARSLHRQLRDGGYSSAQVVDFASNLLDLVRSQISDELTQSTDDTVRPLVAE